MKTEIAIAEARPEALYLVNKSQSLTVKTFEDAMDAADLLLDVKLFAEKITERKEEITKPLNESLKSARALFKGLEDQCAVAESAVKEAILEFHYRNWKKDKPTDNTINGLRGKASIVERTKVNITDESAIPCEFCSPDPVKIEHALKAGIEVRGAELIKTYGLAAGKN